MVECTLVTEQWQAWGWHRQPEKMGHPALSCERDTSGRQPSLILQSNNKCVQIYILHGGGPSWLWHYSEANSILSA